MLGNASSYVECLVCYLVLTYFEVWLPVSATEVLRWLLSYICELYNYGPWGST